MKRLSTILALVAALSGFGAAHASAAAGTDAQLRSFLRAYLEGADDPSLHQARARVAHVPIGGGREEILAYLSARGLCGSGGCTLLVLDRRGSSYHVVTRIAISRPPVRVLPSWHHGRPDLAVFVAGGGIRPGYEAVLPFDGATYADNPTVPPAHPLRGAAGRVVIARDQADEALDGGKH
jgi:hypothetical protein